MFLTFQNVPSLPFHEKAKSFTNIGLLHKRMLVSCQRYQCEQKSQVKGIDVDVKLKYHYDTVIISIVNMN